MRTLASAFVVSLVLISMAPAASDEQVDLPPLWDLPGVGVSPDASIKHWIKLSILSPRNQPSPIVLISPQYVKTATTWLIELPSKQYAAINKVTQATMANSTCLAHPPGYTSLVVLVERHNGTRTVSCEMQQRPFCTYLTDALRPLRQSGSVGLLGPAAEFGTIAGCPAAS
jgi:hypothetical protein